MPTSLSPRETVDLFHALCGMEADLKRRDLLFQLALTLGGSAALPLLRHLDPAERDRLAHVVTRAARLDEPTVDTIEKLIARCRRLDDLKGPDQILPTVDAQREMVAELLRQHSPLPALHERLVIGYAELSQLAGYLHYDMLDYATATQRLREGLDAAMETGDPTLIAYIHTWLGSMANHQHRPGAALDNVYAAQGWLRRSDSKLVRAMNESVAAGALAHRGEESSSRALDRASAFAGSPPGATEPSYLYWLSPAMVRSKAALLKLQLKDPTAAIVAAESTLSALKPSFHLDRAMTRTSYANALVAKREIGAAADQLSRAGRVATSHSSVRLIRYVRETRRRLEPWAGTGYVRRLDEQFRAQGLAPA